LEATTLATALLAGLLSFSGPVTGTARATGGSAAADGTAAAAAPSGFMIVTYALCRTRSEKARQ